MKIGDNDVRKIMKNKLEILGTKNIITEILEVR